MIPCFDPADLEHHGVSSSALWGLQSQQMTARQEAGNSLRMMLPGFSCELIGTVNVWTTLIV